MLRHPDESTVGFEPADAVHAMLWEITAGNRHLPVLSNSFLRSVFASLQRRFHHTVSAAQIDESRGKMEKLTVRKRITGVGIADKLLDQSALHQLVANLVPPFQPFPISLPVIARRLCRQCLANSFCVVSGNKVRNRTIEEEEIASVAAPLFIRIVFFEVRRRGI